MDNKKRLMSLALSLGLITTGAAGCGVEHSYTPEDAIYSVALELKGPYYYVRFMPDNNLTIYVLKYPFYPFDNEKEIQDGAFVDVISKSDVTLFEKEELEELISLFENAGHNINWVKDETQQKMRKKLY